MPIAVDGSIRTRRAFGREPVLEKAAIPMKGETRPGNIGLLLGYIPYCDRNLNLFDPELSAGFPIFPVRQAQLTTNLSNGCPFGLSTLQAGI